MSIGMDDASSNLRTISSSSQYLPTQRLVSANDLRANQPEIRTHCDEHPTPAVRAYQNSTCRTQRPPLVSAMAFCAQQAVVHEPTAGCRIRVGDE